MAGTKGQRSGGRNRKPAALHVVAGTFRQDRHQDQDVIAPAGAPERPVDLSGAALEEWDRVVRCLEAQRTLARVDGIALANHCRLHALVQRLEVEVAALPSLTFEKVTVDGAGTEHREPKVHPLVAQLRTGRQALRTSLVEFGLTPSSRTRVAPTVPAASNPLARFLGKGRQ